LITPSTQDPLAGATAVPASSFTPGDGAAGRSSMPADPAAANGELRDRIHRVAGMAHEAIDKLAQRLDSTGQGVLSARGQGGEKVRQYGDRLRERANGQPLQTIAMALGAGLVVGKLFGGSREPEVRVVEAPAPMPDWTFTDAAERRASGLVDAARARMDRLGDLGLAARDRVGAAAGLGLAGTQQWTSTVARKASDLSQQARLAVERLVARSQDYGSMARSGIQAHPAAGLGAVVGIGALVTALLLQRRREPSGRPPAGVDDNGHPLAWRHQQGSLQHNTRDVVASRPVTSAVVVIGLGALVGALLSRR
jgi:ElaB/YqjD/DUF883 family membrane-anchored ribosome-binding protein